MGDVHALTPSHNPIGPVTEHRRLLATSLKEVVDHLAPAYARRSLHQRPP